MFFSFFFFFSLELLYLAFCFSLSHILVALILSYVMGHEERKKKELESGVILFFVFGSNGVFIS